MKRKFSTIFLAVLLALSLATFASCTTSGGNNDLPVESGEDTIIVDDVNVTPDNYEAKKVVYAAIGRLSKLTTYKSASTGTSVASVAGLFGYTQQTDCVTIKHGDEFYTDSNSDSRFVSLKHEAFSKGDNIAYRINGGQIVNSEAESYKDVFGVTPDKLLSGHVFNDATIVYAEFEGTENGEYTFKYVLDKDKGNALLFRQMKEFGNLNGYPSFTDNTVVHLTVKEDYTPVKFTYTSKYIVNVSVLGDLPCVEENTVVFSDFNGEIEIPDTVAFNEAMASEPSQVIPSEDKPVDKTQEKIVGALLKADLIKGVALNGVVRYNNVEIPVKINGRADVDKIMNDENADILSLIDVKLSMGLYDDSLAVTYHDKKLYVDLPGVKFVKELPLEEVESVTSGIPGMLKSADLASYVKITEEEGDMYRVRLNSVMIEGVIKSVLKNAGLAGDNVDEKFDLSVGLYIPTDRVGVISLNLTTDLVDISADFNLADERFVQPVEEDYTAEPQILRTGIKADIALADFTASATGYVSYDITEFNPQNALKAELNVTLGDSLKSIMSMAGMFSKDVPAWLGTVAKADTLNLVYAEGKMMLAALKDGKATFAVNIPLEKDSDGENGDSEDVSLDFETIKALASAFLELKVSDNVFSVNVKQEMMSLVGLIWNQVPELIMNEAGQLAGAMLGAYIGKPLQNIGFDFDAENKTFNLYIDAYDVGVASGDVYIEGREYDTVRLLNLTLAKISADEYVFGWDIDKMYDDCLKAEEVMNATATISTASMREGYSGEVTRVKTLYAALTDDQKALCYAVSGENYYDKLISESEKLKKSVDDFAKTVDLGLIKILNSTYNKFTDEQKAYFASAHPDKYEKYIEKRVKNEADSAASVKAFAENVIVHTESDLDAMTNDEIYELFKTFANNYETICGLCDKSLEGIDLTNFYAELGAVVKAYAGKIGTLADNTKYEVQYADGLSVSELIALYNRVDGFYKKYADNFDEMKIWAKVTEIDPQLLIKCYLTEYYLKYNGSGFRKYAVLAVESEINALKELANGEYDETEYKTRIDNVETLKGLTDESAISNLNELGEIKTAFYEALAAKLKTEIPAVTEKMKTINNDASAEGIDWEGVHAEVTACSGKINLLSAEYKLKLTKEIAAFDIQKSKFEKNYSNRAN